MAYNIGINVIETEGNSSPAISGAPTSVAGFILRSQRGPIAGDPARVSNFRQFAERFGSHCKDYVGAYCVEGFFLNGGQEAYIARIVGQNSQAASVTLKDRATKNVLKVTAGYRGKAEVGEWGNDLYLDIEHKPAISTPLIKDLGGNKPTRLTGTAINSEPLNLSPFTKNLPRTLTIKVDQDSFTIDFSHLPAPSCTSTEEIVATINDQGRLWIAATVKQDVQHNNVIQLVTRSKGKPNKIEIVKSAYEETLERLGIANSDLEVTGAATQGYMQGKAVQVPLNLEQGVLSVKQNSQEAIQIDFQTILPNTVNPTAVTAKEVEDAINTNNELKEKLHIKATPVEGDENKVFFRLYSVTEGADSKIEILESTAKQTLGFDDFSQQDGQAATNAQLKGTDIDTTIDLAASAERTLSLKVDGELITFILPSYTGVAITKVIDDINKQAIDKNVKLEASCENGLNNKVHIVLKSKTSGKDSKISVKPDNTCTLLGLTPQSVVGEPGNSTYTSIEVTNNDGFHQNDLVYLDDGITQDWFEVSGIRIDKDPNNPTTKLFYVDFKEQGRNEYLIRDNATLYLYPKEFTLKVYRKSADDTKYQLLETWEKLSLNTKEISRVNELSAYICLESYDTGVPDAGSQICLGSVFPISTSNLERQAGNDGDLVIPIPAYEDAFGRFDTVPIQLLAVLEKMERDGLSAITKKAVAYCENKKGDCMFIGHTPFEHKMEDAREFGASLQGSKVYGALYWPWIQVTDPIGEGSNPTRWVPTTGHVMGVYARIDQTRGIWKAPAGNEAVLRGALSVEQNITDTDHTYLVKEGSVNGIRMIRGAGIVIDASRTLSTDSRWLYVNIRLLFNYVKASLREELRWVKQEPNREALWNTIKFNTVTPFLQRLYHSGAFGPGLSKDVFTVVCGPENNPPDRIKIGELKVEVYFYPARPAETIIIVIGQQDSGATASER